MRSRIRWISSARRRFSFSSATARDAPAARDRGDPQHGERQGHHAADADERLDERLRPLHGAGGSRAVRHQHDGPASLRFLAHRPAATSYRTFAPAPSGAGAASTDLRRTRTGRRGQVPEWKSKVGIEPGGVNTADREPGHDPSGITLARPWAWGKG